MASALFTRIDVSEILSSGQFQSQIYIINILVYESVLLLIISTNSKSELKISFLYFMFDQIIYVIG